jgi:MFS family permease
MPQQTTHVRRNITVLALDFITFSIGFAFWDPTIVIPAFVQELTGSTVAVGLMTAVRVLVLTLPQVWAASFLMGRPRKQPLLVWSCVIGRLPILALVLAILLWGRSAIWAVGLVLALTYAAFYASEGLNVISWPDLVGKVVPPRIRGRFLGYGQLISSLGALGSGYLVHLVLGANGLKFPTNWAALFTCALVGMLLSLFAIMAVKEEPDTNTPYQAVNLRRDIAALVQCVRSDSRLRRLIAIQLLLGLAGAAFPFFIVRAREGIVGGGELVGLFLSMQNLGGMGAALILGNLIDHIGSWLAIRIITVLQVLCLLVVTVGGLMGEFKAAYMLAFALLGFVAGGSWWSYTSYILDLATEKQRPLYLAATGVLQSVNALSAALVGVLLGVFVAEGIFGAAVLISLVGAALAWTLPRLKPHSQPSVENATS